MFTLFTFIPVIAMQQFWGTENQQKQQNKSCQIGENA